METDVSWRRKRKRMETGVFWNKSGSGWKRVFCWKESGSGWKQLFCWKESGNIASKVLFSAVVSVWSKLSWEFEDFPFSYFFCTVWFFFECARGFLRTCGLIFVFVLMKDFSLPQCSLSFHCREGKEVETLFADKTVKALKLTFCEDILWWDLFTEEWTNPKPSCDISKTRYSAIQKSGSL